MIELQSYVSNSYLWLMLGPLMLLLAMDVSGRLYQFAAIELPASEAETWFARLYQHWRLRHSRLARMLEGLGIERRAYLQTQSVAQLRAQLSRCASCPATGQCDAALAGRAVREQVVSFCPNAETLVGSLNG